MEKRVQSLLRGVQFGQFLSVGAVGAVFDNLVLVGLVDVGNLTPVVGKIISGEAAILFMFVLNEWWTFAGTASRSPGAIVRRLLRSNVVRLGGVGIALGVLYFLNHYLGVWYLLANTAGIGVGSIFNYVFETIFTWRIHSEA
ncbi:GtrA family protein [Halorussus sp. MSC15.2]|uniref:GtrA family protein n=1 Tax=Halorussus sp. MSC15.2 TaxID=2283638 RepID=UPI0013D7E406|nr:GtrA family protein [Halorussus sp. MSC15.2]NEU55349.1 GtrA family protein [Halorussus sp. MSC15.2]